MAAFMAATLRCARVFCVCTWDRVGETRASCYNVQLKSFVKSMLDALFLSMYTLNVLFVLIKCTIPLIFRTIDKYICEVPQARSTVTTSLANGASCHI